MFNNSSDQFRFQFLSEECKIFKDLLVETKREAQLSFRYYTALIAIIFSSILFLIDKINSADEDKVVIVNNNFVLLGILLLTIFIGFLYVINFSYNYGNLVRYRENIDRIRIMMLQSRSGNYLIYPYYYFDIINMDKRKYEKFSERKTYFHQIFLPPGFYQSIIFSINLICFSGIYRILFNSQYPLYKINFLSIYRQQWLFGFFVFGFCTLSNFLSFKIAKLQAKKGIILSNY